MTLAMKAKARLQADQGFVHVDAASIGPIKKGGFHAWLGKDPSEPITDADIAKGKAAGGHPAKMASFAESARKWKHK